MFGWFWSNSREHKKDDDAEKAEDGKHTTEATA